MKNFNIDKDKSKEMIKIGLILILSAGLIAFIVLINFYYTDKAMSNNNMQRLTRIETFLNQQIQAAQEQAQAAPAEVEKK